MTEKRSDAEMLKLEMVDALRTAIRLKHRHLANRELNEVLPEAERQFDIALLKGKLLDKKDVSALVSRVVG